MKFTVALFFLGSSLLQQHSIVEYFKSFPYRPDEVSLDENEYTRITVDEKNGFLEISYDDPDYSFEYGGQLQFTYFVKANKEKIFGYTSFSEGPSSDHASYAFYTCTNNKWTEVAPLQELDLDLFTDNDELLEKVGGDYRVRVELPQHGTDITASVFPVGENDAPFDYSAYLDFINGLPRLTFSFDKAKGEIYFE